MFPGGGFNFTPRIFRLRGLDICLHLGTVLVLLFFLADGWGKGGAVGVAYVAIMIAALFVIILWHELGHAWAARRSRLRVTGIVLSPLGGECQIVGGLPSPGTDVFVSLAGPGAHLVLAALAAPVWLLPRGGLAAPALQTAWIWAVFILAFNLIPAFPLDGGRVLRALLTYKLGEVPATRVAARVGQGFAALYFLLALTWSQPLFAVLAVYIFISAEGELRAAMYAGYVYEPGARNVFAASLGVREDWSREALEGYGRAEKPGFWQRMKTRRRLRRLAGETARRDKLKAEVDRVLEKVSREGMPSLTSKERRVLKEASGEYRKP